MAARVRRVGDLPSTHTVEPRSKFTLALSRELGTTQTCFRVETWISCEVFVGLVVVGCDLSMSRAHYRKSRRPFMLAQHSLLWFVVHRQTGNFDRGELSVGV